VNVPPVAIALGPSIAQYAGENNGLRYNLEITDDECAPVPGDTE